MWSFSPGGDRCFDCHPTRILCSNDAAKVGEAPTDLSEAVLRRGGRTAKYAMCDAIRGATCLPEMRRVVLSYVCGGSNGCIRRLAMRNARPDNAVIRIRW